MDQAIRRKWQLLGLAKTDLATAGKALSQLIGNDSDEIPQLRVLAQYYGAAGDTQALDATARRLVKISDNNIAQLKKFAKQAVGQNQLAQAQLLIQKIEALNPKADDLADLRQQVVELQRTQDTLPKLVSPLATR